MRIDAWRSYLRARVHAWLGRNEAELRGYREALRSDPGFTRAAHALAFALGEREDVAEARALLQTIVQADPADASAWYNLGYLCERTGEPASAAEAFRRTVELRPRFYRAWYGLGLSQGALGEHAEAAAAFERVVKADALNGEAWYALGMSYHRLEDRDKVANVIRHLDRFDRHRAKRLIVDTERTDLAHVVADLETLG